MKSLPSPTLVHILGLQETLSAFSDPLGGIRGEARE